MLDAEGHGELVAKAYNLALHNGSPHLQRLAVAGDATALLETYTSLADIHVRLRNPGFEQAVASIYEEILLRDFSMANSELYARMGDFFASVGMEAESVKSYLKAGRNHAKN